jgi:hypothetical protein
MLRLVNWKTCESALVGDGIITAAGKRGKSNFYIPTHDKDIVFAVDKEGLLTRDRGNLTPVYVNRVCVDNDGIVLREGDVIVIPHGKRNVRIEVQSSEEDFPDPASAKWYNYTFFTAGLSMALITWGVFNIDTSFKHPTVGAWCGAILLFWGLINRIRTHKSYDSAWVRIVVGALLLIASHACFLEL